jgi:hypothetical protein
MTETKQQLRFLPTIDLWANGGIMQDAIRTGQLQLLPGQWVQCGPGPKSRFVCVRPGGSLWVVHAEGHPENPTIKTQRFSEICALWTGKIDQHEFRQRRQARDN